MQLSMARMHRMPGRHLEAVEEQHEELQEQDSWAVSTAGDLQELRTCEC